MEIKFSIAPEEAAHLGRLPLIKATTRGRAVSRRLFSVYYDTPDWALQREGVGLRLRRDGTRWTQTLKTAGQVQAGLHLRDELDTPVPAQILNYHALAESRASTVFNDSELRASLQPAFVTDFKRALREVEPAPGTLVELCVDSGTITAGAAATPISEVELELKVGQVVDLLDFARQLLQHVPMRLEPRSKAQRGYALAAGTAPAPTKASTPTLRAEMSVTDAFGQVILSCLNHLQVNEPGLLDSEDEEYLHQARVALRRLRSAFSVFRQALPRAAFEALLTELRWLGGHLGPARDWDVFATESLPALATAFPGDHGLPELIERAASRRAAADQGAREAVVSARYATLLLDIVSALYRQPWMTLADEAATAERSLPLPEFASAVLRRHHRKVVKGGRDHAKLDAAALHALRIQIKKLRYAAEFFCTLYDRKKVRDYTTALAGLQELLGGLNDAATVERLCQTLREERQQWIYPETLGLARGWAAASARVHLERLPEAWRRFRHCQPFWEREE